MIKIKWPSSYALLIQQCAWPLKTKHSKAVCVALSQGFSARSLGFHDFRFENRDSPILCSAKTVKSWGKLSIEYPGSSLVAGARVGRVFTDPLSFAE